MQQENQFVSKRSHDYRKKFFKNTSPDIGNLYFCTYCGKLIPKEKGTVDHIISCKKAQSSKIARWFLQSQKIQNVNELKNLCFSCKRCNGRKATKIGLYPIRAYLGKHFSFQMIRLCVRIAFAISFLLIVIARL